MLIIIYLLLEFYFSLTVWGDMGFLQALIWILLTFFIGSILLKQSANAIKGNLFSVMQGKQNLLNFRNASISYVFGSILLMIPGVFSDSLGVIALLYSGYLSLIANITPSKPIDKDKKEDREIIDVEIIEK